MTAGAQAAEHRHKMIDELPSSLFQEILHICKNHGSDKSAGSPDVQKIPSPINNASDHSYA